LFDVYILVGYACALQSAKEKLENAYIHMQQYSIDSVIISFQDFLAELSTDRQRDYASLFYINFKLLILFFLNSWHELAVIMLKDKANNIELTVFTETIPVANEDIAQLQQLTPLDYPLKWAGFSCRLPEKNFNFNASNNSYTYLSYESPDIQLSQARISHALKSLAALYKCKLLSVGNSGR
jgi:hypothetical protein